MVMTLAQKSESSALDDFAAYGSQQRPPLSVPPPQHTRMELMQKRRGVRLLIAHVRQQEEKMRVQQACLDSLLMERVQREEQLKAANSLLSSDEDVELLKERLRKARESRQKAVDRITDAEACISFAHGVAQESYLAEERRRRECTVVKKSVVKLRAEVVKLRAQLKKLTNNVNVGDVHKSLPEHSERTKGVGNHRLSATDVAKLGEEKLACEERLREAHDACTKAARREAKAAQLLAALEKRTRSAARWLGSSVCPPSAKMAPPHGGVDGNKWDDDADAPGFHQVSGTLVGVSVSSAHETGVSKQQASEKPVSSATRCPRSYVEEHRERKIMTSVPMIAAGPSDFSDKEELTQDVKQLGARLARMAQQVGRMRHNLLQV